MTTDTPSDPTAAAPDIEDLRAFVDERRRLHRFEP